MIYYTGGMGRLGQELRKLPGYEPLFFNVASSYETERKLLDLNHTDILIHCAAMTDVDACESTEIRKCRQVNGIGTAIVREHFPGRMIYISTDFVFDGLHGPYSESAPTRPINNYGMSKLMGEDAITNRDRKDDTIIRTTMLYSLIGKPDFVRWVKVKLHKGEPFEVYMNEYTTPTYVPHLVKAIDYIVKWSIRTPIPKIVNVVGKDWMSKYEFAIMIANVFGLNPALIKPARSSRTEATRPLKAGLKTNLAEKLGVPIYSVLEGLRSMHMPNIEDAVKDYETNFDSSLDGLVANMENIRNDFVFMLRRSSELYSALMLVMMQLNITELEITDYMAKANAIGFMPPMAVRFYPDEEGTGGKVWISPMEIKKEGDDENGDSDTLP